MTVSRAQVAHRAKVARRARKDRKLGALPLGEAKCDECDVIAYTRWYDRSEGRESIAYTLCERHNEEMLEENRRRREELGLAERSKNDG